MCDRETDSNIYNIAKTTKQLHAGWIELECMKLSFKRQRTSTTLKKSSAKISSNKFMTASMILILAPPKDSRNNTSVVDGHFAPILWLYCYYNSNNKQYLFVFLTRNLTFHISTQLSCLRPTWLHLTLDTKFALSLSTKPLTKPLLLSAPSSLNLRLLGACPFPSHVT